ncbi:MAG: hypothetical protein ACREH3_09175, partial [Geminicoccales bacterium]
SAISIAVVGVLICAPANAASYTITVNSDGTYTPQWLDILDGEHGDLAIPRSATRDRARAPRRLGLSGLV